MDLSQIQIKIKSLGKAMRGYRLVLFGVIICSLLLLPLAINANTAMAKTHHAGPVPYPPNLIPTPSHGDVTKHHGTNPGAPIKDNGNSKK